MYDVVIIGGGPAGLTSALYAGRSKLKTKLIEKASLGGQTLLTDLIENFPGVYRMNSSDWVGVLKKQLAELTEVEIIEETAVEKIEKIAGIFKIHTNSSFDAKKDILESHSVIVATGAYPKKVGIKGEDAFVGKGVSYCATCDGPLFKEKELVLIGGGDTALEEALFLTKFAKHLTVIHRRDELRATAILQDRVRVDKKIALKLETVPLEIIGKTRVEGVRVKNVKTEKEEILGCDGIFIFVGFQPENNFLKGLVSLNEHGYIVSNDHMATSCEGIFACGDCRHRPFNQVVTACNDGAIAAFAAHKYLDLKFKHHES